MENETETFPNETAEVAGADNAASENEIHDAETGDTNTGESEPETTSGDAGAEPEVRFGELRERLQTGGRWRPQWDALGMEAFCGRLDAGAREWFEQFLEHTPPVVPMEELAGDSGGIGPAEGPPARRNTMTPGAAVNQDSMQLHRATVAYCESHPETDYATALRRVAAGG